MKLALRKTAPTNATWVQRLACWAIKARLVSQYCHGGIVIGGVLFHVTAAHGYQKLYPGEWTPEHWDITDVGGNDAAALAIFDTVSKPPAKRWQRVIWRLLKGYDWFSLLAFVGPLVRVWWLNYCFELCWWMMTGQRPTGRVTAEMLLVQALKARASRARTTTHAA